MSKQIIKSDQLIIKELKGKKKLNFVVSNNTTLTLIIKIINTAEIQLNIHLSGRGAKATIIGIILGKNNEKISLETQQIHEAPETTSNLLIKTVLRDCSQCDYHGGIRVEKAAQKTDAYQRNEILLLSNLAKAQSEPALEILANDVRCTHGATVSSLNEDQLWYLTSRGILAEKAKKLLINGFLTSALDMIDAPELKDKIKQQLFDKV